MRVREYFLLEEARQRSGRLAGPRLATIRRYRDAALRRLAAAQDLRGRAFRELALSLYRESSLLLIFGFLVAEGKSEDPASMAFDAGIAAFDSAIGDGTTQKPPGYHHVKPWLASNDLLRPVPALEGETGRTADEFEKLTDWLLEATDVRPVQALRVSRVVRIASSIALLVGLLVFIGIRIFSPKNLAFHKPVTATATAFDTTVEGAVDGEKNGTFGYCSIETESPSLTIDLTRKYAIDRVKVFGRGDCCYGQSIPLTLELSDDGLTYRKVAERTEEFTESRPWIVTLPSDVGRFLRLTTQRRSYLVLGEVEAYGRPAQ